MTSHKAILVANSFVARLFEQSHLQQPWVETRDWWHAEGRMHARELERAPLGIHWLDARAWPRTSRSVTVSVRSLPMIWRSTWTRHGLRKNGMRLKFLHLTLF